jgi:hypothetical protein
LNGKYRFSDADVERARLLHEHPLQQCRPDAERLPIFNMPVTPL